MVAVVSIDEDGAVCVTIDADPSETPDAALVGLDLDDLLARASATALSTWRELRIEAAEDTTEAGE